MNFELNPRNIGLLAFLVILLVIGGILYNIRHGEPEVNEAGRRTLLNDYSRFFTVSNSANTYINVLARGDTHNLLILLSDDYIARNNLNPHNVLNHLGPLEGDLYDFQARRIYQYQLSPHMMKYYIRGHLREERLNEWIEPEIYYLILILDLRNFTFSITPYDGTSFRGNA